MSGGESPVNGGLATTEPAVRLTVRKDLFPDPLLPDATSLPDEDISCVKLETDFEQSIDEIAIQKQQVANGMLESSSQPRHRKHKQHSRTSDLTTINGLPPREKKRKKHHDRDKKSKNNVFLQVKGGKNLNLVSSSECQVRDDDDDDYVSSDNEVLKYSVKLPIVQRQSGKPYSHELSQLKSKKNKYKHSEKRTHVVIPSSGKPRSMLGICSSKSKKKKKIESKPPTYQSQIVNTKTNIKIKIRRTNAPEPVIPAPSIANISELGQRKSKKKRAASPVASESSGEEYDPSRGDTPASMSVAAPKPRHPTPKAKKPAKSKNEKTEKSKASKSVVVDTGPQSPWATSMPEEILVKIFDLVVASKGTLPTVVRLGKICKLWHSASCRPELWRHVDLAQYTVDKCKTDYKLVWLLENRLSLCHSLNIAQWKVCNETWVLACVADYCPQLQEISLCGWGRLTPEQLFDLVQGLPKLQRLDLSLTSETGSSSTCLSAISMARICENFGSRLTHLTLANNKFTALPQILSSIAAHCCNLEVLDISGAQATSHPAAVPLEALQRGCPRVRVFRAANAQLVLASATNAQLTEACGWEMLEELSIAAEAATERVGVGEYRLGDDALARLVRSATRLRLLDLRGLQRLTDSGLVRVPAWELQHLFLGGCNVLRQSSAGLELICQKWSHSLIELDLSWATAGRVLDQAVFALAEPTSSKLKTLNLCGSAVSLEPVKKVLLKCLLLESINLSSCRALPRGMKRLYTGKELQELKDSFDPEKAKAKEKSDDEENASKKKKKKKEDTKAETSVQDSSKNETESSTSKLESKFQDSSSSSVFQEPKSVSESSNSNKQTLESKSSPNTNESKGAETTTLSESKESRTPKLLSPSVQSRPDSSSTPRSEPAKTDVGSPHFSPVNKQTDCQVQNSPDMQQESTKPQRNTGHYKTTPTHKSEASPLNRMESQTKLKHGKAIEQCSPTTSVENKPSPETANVKQDMKTPGSWNYGSYSPMPRQDQFSSQRSPYSAQPSPAQPSPYSAQPSPYSTQPSPYSSQPSPYSAQPSPDTSQVIKPDVQKSTSWNSGNFSPMPKHHAPFSPHPTPSPHQTTLPSPHQSTLPSPHQSTLPSPHQSTLPSPHQTTLPSPHPATHPSPHPSTNPSPRPNTLPSPHPTSHLSPDTGLTKVEKSNSSKTQYSPMSRHDRIHQSPYSPRPSADNVAYSNKKSPGMGGFSPMMRSDCHLPSLDAQASRPIPPGRAQDIYGRSVKVPDILQNPLPDLASAWSLDKFNQMSNAVTAAIDSLSWSSAFGNEPMPGQRTDGQPGLLNTPPPMQQNWTGLPSFESTVGRTRSDSLSEWTLGQFRVEPPQQMHNQFVEQNVTFDSLSHAALASHLPANFLDDAFTESSRVD